MLRQRKLARGPGKLRLPLRGILLGSLVLLSLASSLWTLRRVLGADRAPDLMNGARMLRSLAPNTCAHRACRCAAGAALTCAQRPELINLCVCQAPRARRMPAVLAVIVSALLCSSIAACMGPAVRLLS